MKRKISLMLICGIVLLNVCGCSNSNNNINTNDNLNESKNEVENEKQEIKDPFTVSDEKGYASDEYWYYIDGTITNTTDTNFTYAEIDYILYDNSGATLTTCYTNITYLEAKGIWKYSVHCPMAGGNANNVSSFKMKEYKYNW